MQSLANVALWALALLGTIQSGQARPTSKPYNVLTWEEAYAKAENLLSQMTLEQKVNLTTGTGNENGPCEGNTAPVENPHFPALCLNDGPIGLREARNISVFVTGINACASFDRNLIRQRAEYMGAEFHDKGVNVLLGPGMNLMRSPRGGRNWEFGSEDPYLLGIVSAETITGIQSSGVMATAKHFIGNEQELNRSTSSTDMDDRTLHEIYLWPFARSVEAGVTAVMCAYNKVNGTYACEDDYTLNHVLKGELDFKGFVMSDWWATHSTATSANHGMDMSMPGDANDQSITGGGLWYGKNLTDAVKEGKVDESRVHDMALRIAASWYKVGQDKDYPPLNFNYFEPSVGEDLDVQRNHKENIRAMGRDSLILLRNENNILPLKEDSLKKLAIIGSDAGPDPNGLNACPANSCDNGTLAQGWGSGTAMYPYLVTPIDGIKARAPESWEIISTLDDRDLDKAAQVAAEGDIAMVFANSDSGEQYITVAGNVGDRNNVSLWNNGDNLIKAVADANENTIVVIHSVGTIDMPWLDHPNIKALVWPGLPGQETGNSLADVLFGDYAPGGKLPYTIAPEKDFPAEPSPEDHVVYKEKLLIGYRWFDAKNITPQFEFGFGLSYTTFEIDNLKLKSSGKGDKIKVSATVTVENTGDMEGSEVVQAYISFPESAGEPPKVLRGFEKVLLKPGKKTKVKFEFTKTELSIWDTVKQSWVVPSGEFKLLVGASSRDIRQTATFTL